MISTKSGTIGKLLLASASLFPPQSSHGEEQRVITPSPSSREQGALAINTLSFPLGFDAPDLPERVLQKTRELSIDPTTVKLQEGMWVECNADGCTPLLVATNEERKAFQTNTPIKGLRTGDTLTITGHRYKSHKVEAESNYGIPGLGKFTTESDGTKTFTPAPDFEGTVARRSEKVLVNRGTTSAIKGTNSSRTISYSAEKLGELQEEIQNQLDTNFVLIISVPKLCPPCRSYKATVANAVQVNYGGPKVSFVTINFNSFEEARRRMGTVKVFPTTVVYKAVQQGFQSEEKSDDATHNQFFLPSIARPSSTYSGALTPSSLDIVIKRALK